MLLCVCKQGKCNASENTHHHRNVIYLIHVKRINPRMRTESPCLSMFLAHSQINIKSPRVLPTGMSQLCKSKRDACTWRDQNLLSVQDYEDSHSWPHNIKPITRCPVV